MNNEIIFLIIAVLMLSGCSNNTNNINGNAVVDTKQSVNIEKLEIYHFHGTNQCYSCKTVGAYAEETVNTYFADELKSGKIVFGHINGELPENKDLVVKYGVTSASLWLGTYTKDGQFSAEQNTNVWYKISNKEDYMNYLKGIIEKRLAGDLS
jgi:thioredoxin-related protein